MAKKFEDYQEQCLREKENRKTWERAKILQIEDEMKREKEEQIRREIERKAIEQYKKEQEAHNRRAAEKRENFKNELARLGITPEQIETIVESSNLDFQVINNSTIVPDVSPSSPLGQLSSMTQETSSVTSRKSRLRLPW